MFPELDRARAVAALEIVDQVVILDSGRVESLIGHFATRCTGAGKRI